MGDPLAPAKEVTTMPRRKKSSDESKLKKGRGQGHGQSYTPFLYTREVPSLGKSTRIKGWKTERPHHFLSDIENNYFLTLEWSQRIVDIREQFPLPQDATQKIAERLSIRHPHIPKTGEDTVMTTDFLIDVEDDGDIRMVARTVKYASDLNDARTVEKLEIERTYWTEQGVDWGIVTEFEIPKSLAHNADWLHSSTAPEDAPGFDPTYIAYLEDQLFSEIITAPDNSLAKACLSIDARFGLKGGASLWVAKHLIATRQWEVDMMVKIDPSRPLIVSRSALMEARKRV